MRNGGIASALGLRSLGLAFSYDPTRRATTPHVAFGYDPTRRSVSLKWTVRQKAHDKQNTLNPKSGFQNLKFAF